MQKGGVVKSKILLLFVGLALAQSATQAQLGDLIRGNVQDATKSYNRLVTEQPKDTPQLWIHVRNEGQMKLVVDNLSSFRTMKLGGQAVDVRPIQLVTSGPQGSQLRFFKQEDRKQAPQLLAEIKKVLPRLQLQDLSGQYKGVDWIKPGHYELWLSRDVIKIDAAKR